MQIELEEILKSFEINMDEFIDLCILSGCDYTPTITGFGPATGLKMIKDCGTLEAVIRRIEKENRDPKKKRKAIPQEFLYEESRQLFKNPEVIRNIAQINA